MTPATHLREQEIIMRNDRRAAPSRVFSQHKNFRRVLPDLEGDMTSVWALAALWRMSQRSKARYPLAGDIR
jgi:hypothetical protein